VNASLFVIGRPREVLFARFLEKNLMLAVHDPFVSRLMGTKGRLFFVCFTFVFRTFPTSPCVSSPLFNFGERAIDQVSGFFGYFAPRFCSM